MIAVDSAEYKALSPIERLLNMPKLKRTESKLRLKPTRPLRKKNAITFKATHEEIHHIRAFREAHGLNQSDFVALCFANLEEAVKRIDSYAIDFKSMPLNAYTKRSENAYSDDHARLNALARDIGWERGLAARALMLATIDIEAEKERLEGENHDD